MHPIQHDFGCPVPPRSHITSHFIVCHPGKTKIQYLKVFATFVGLKSTQNTQSNDGDEKKDGGEKTLGASKANDWIKMTRNHLMKRNSSTRKKLASCLIPVLQKTSIRLFERFPTAKHSGEMYIRNLFRYVQLMYEPRFKGVVGD